VHRKCATAGTSCRIPKPIGLFPTLADNRAVRVVACLRTAAAIVAIILAAVGGVHERIYLAGAWTTVGLAIDFFLGTLFGSSASPLGSITVVSLSAFGDALLHSRPRPLFPPPALSSGGRSSKYLRRIFANFQIRAGIKCPG
jgi:hypothetical protein